MVEVTTLVAGDGVHFPKKGQIVAIHYDAFLAAEKAEGKQWDSTHKRAKPLRFRLGQGQVIPGLDEGVGTLSLAGKARIAIPACLAYGKRGFPGLVPPDTDVIFNVELVDIL